MSRESTLHIILALGLGLAVCSAAAVPSADEREPRSPRNANYTIEATLDTGTRTIEARQVVNWTNLQEQPTDELWFHLYWNAWRNDRSTWMLERRLRKRAEDEPDDFDRDDWGWIEVESVLATADAGIETLTADLTSAMRHASPDDGNPHDRTVMVLDLPGPVEKGQTIELELVWRAKVPRTFARTGFRGDYYFIAHWFPKLGVYEAEGWNCHQFHASTEFFSDYGVYDVRLNVPTEFVVGATGREIAREDQGDGTTTHHYREADVHAFSWTASPDFVERVERFESPGLPSVAMRLLIQPEHQGQSDRYFAATRTALRLYGTWYTPYPYGHVTIVDPAWGSGSGGMEYPTLFTGGTRLFNPFGGDRPEGVTIHEAGHQFWYGIAGNNEFEHAWLDEGINTFSTIRALEAAYEPKTLVTRYLPLPGQTSSTAGLLALERPSIRVSRWVGRQQRYRRFARADDQSVASYRYYPESAAAISYGKTALWLATLERHLGWETLQPILARFHETSRFSHPTPEDFVAVAEEVSGRELGWFFDQVLDSSVEFDYAVKSVASFPAEAEGWVVEQGRLVYKGPVEPEGLAEPVYRTEVVVQRRGGGRFPVDVTLVFEDGHEIRERWNGMDHWRLFAVERPAKLDYAEVDPDRVLMLDVHRTNNGRYLASRARLPAVKWGTRWMVWLQDLLTTFAFFV